MSHFACLFKKKKCLILLEEGYILLEKNIFSCIGTWHVFPFHSMKSVGLNAYGNITSARDINSFNLSYSLSFESVMAIFLRSENYVALNQSCLCVLVIVSFINPLLHG